MPKPSLLVVGGGVAGMTCALESAKRGFPVYLIEKDQDIGGWAYNYCCKATDKCAKCSACLAPQLKSKVEQNPLISIWRNSQVIGMAGTSGDYLIKIKESEQTADLRAGAVILATGFEHFDASKKGEFAYGREKDVITGWELEQLLNEKGSLTAHFANVKKIGFVQCVGSRDLSLGNNYCSSVCCTYASRLAKLINFSHPEVDITVFYMDLQIPDQELCNNAAAEDKKLRYVRGIPSKIYGFPNERLTVRYTDSLKGQTIEDEFDIVVLSAAFTPRKETSNLARIFQIETDEYGFFNAGFPDVVVSKQPGVFIAGACQSPKSIIDSIEQSKSAVGHAIGFLTTVSRK